MIIAGAKGFAVEVLQECYNNNVMDNIMFFDDVSADLEDVLYNDFKILKSIEDVATVFKTVDKQFVLGLGNPKHRKYVAEKLIAVGGQLISLISSKAQLGSFNTTLQIGCNIMSGAIITNNVTLGKGCLVNLNATIGHDSVIGDYVEISPGVNVSGRCKIGDFCSIGSSAVLLPGVKLGHNVTVGAGAVVVKDVPDNCLVVGVPAKIVKSNF